MKLSVVTVNYNNGDGLRKTVRSVVSQSFKDMEYVVVDGGSTDGSVDVLKALMPEGDAGYKWVSEPDTGIYNAMNKGIRMSAGEYLLFLNSGDFLISDDVLERVFSSAGDADVICCRCNVSKDGALVWTSEKVPEHITLGWLYWHGIMHQSTFIKRTLFESIGYYDESFRLLADVQFWHKAFIYNDATCQPLDIITTDYNLEGLSHTKRYTKEYKAEASWRDSQPVLRNIMPDFKEWERDKRTAREYAWIDRHALLRKMLRCYSKIAKRLKSRK